MKYVIEMDYAEIDIVRDAVWRLYQQAKSQAKKARMDHARDRWRDVAEKCVRVDAMLWDITNPMTPHK